LGIITHAYEYGGTYDVKLVVTDVDGCQDSITTRVIVDTVTADAGSNINACTNASTTLNGSGGTIYSWSPAQFLSDDDIANPIATVTTTTKFYLTVRNAIGCTATDSVSIIITPPTTFNAPTADVPVCETKSVQLQSNNSAQFNYTWSPGTYLNNSSIANPVATPLASIQYAVTITDPTCNDDSTFLVDVTLQPAPIVSAQRLNDIDCTFPSSVLQATGAQTYSWTPAAGLDNPNKQNPLATPTATTLFTVVGTDQFGCSASDTVTVKVTNAGQATFLLPNAFSPNNDGHNECFGIRKWGNVTIKEFSIFNRWGQRVFTTKNPSQCWDGTFQGRVQPTGGFAYIIKASSVCGEIQRSGIVMLIH
ncbi:MAG: gliding motility-associated C-terminal domain-containing protein, partial [Chitinophagaceae bacterium]|nr:gliding motility-associated C-terminal domain-containing protein [Chitinophagaceae bacterium]